MGIARSLLRPLSSFAPDDLSCAVLETVPRSRSVTLAPRLLWFCAARTPKLVRNSLLRKRLVVYGCLTFCSMTSLRMAYIPVLWPKVGTGSSSISFGLPTVWLYPILCSVFFLLLNSCSGDVGIEPPFIAWFASSLKTQGSDTMNIPFVLAMLFEPMPTLMLVSCRLPRYSLEGISAWFLRPLMNLCLYSRFRLLTS